MGRNMQSLFKCLTVVLLLAILVLSLMPAEFRPETGLPHNIEHGGIFALLGGAMVLGYRPRFWAWVTLGPLFAGRDRSPSAWRSGKTCEAKRFFSRCWRSLVRIRLRGFSIEDPATEGDPRSAAKDKITSPSRGGESSLAPIQSIDRELGCCDQLCLSFDQGNPESGRTYMWVGPQPPSGLTFLLVPLS